jgi:putative addiction module component (TIGR02574 family)
MQNRKRAAMRCSVWLADNLSLVSLLWYKKFMSLMPEQIFHDALALPDDQRAELATRLLQSLDQEVDPDAEEAWVTEIERRCAALDAGETVPADWDDVRRRIEKELLSR